MAIEDELTRLSPREVLAKSGRPGRLQVGDLVSLNRDGTIFKTVRRESSDPEPIGQVVHVHPDGTADVAITTNEHKHVQRLKVGHDNHVCAKCGGYVEPSKAWYGSVCRTCEFLSLL